MNVIGQIMPDSTIYAGISPVSGFPMFVSPKDYPKKSNFLDAIISAGHSNLLGYNDWRLPSQDELDVLYKHKIAIGGFQNEYYRCSSPHYFNVTWVHHFGTGRALFCKREDLYFIRLIRGIDL